MVIMGGLSGNRPRSQCESRRCFFLGGDTEDRPRGLDRWPSRASGRVEGGIFGYVDRVMIGL